MMANKTYVLQLSGYYSNYPTFPPYWSVHIPSMMRITAVPQRTVSIHRDKVANHFKRERKPYCANYYCQQGDCSGLVQSPFEKQPNILCNSIKSYSDND